jgi:hypothetical protein
MTQANPALHDLGGMDPVENREALNATGHLNLK